LCRNSAAGGELAEQAASLAAAQGFLFWDAFASALKGWAWVQLGQAVEGSRVIAGALDAVRSTGTQFFLAYIHALLAEGHLQSGAFAEGLAAANAGLVLAETTLDRSYAPELWRLKGELLLNAECGMRIAESKSVSQNRSTASIGGGRRSKGNPQSPIRNPQSNEAERCLLRALELSRAAQAKSLELRAATSLARHWGADGRAAEARGVLGSVCKWFGTRAPTADLVEARALLSELTTGR